MRIINRIYQTEPFVVHAQGDSRDICHPIFIEAYQRTLVLPEDLSILTVQTGNNSLLQNQLQGQNIPYHNPAEDFHGQWNNQLKPQFIIEGLEEIHSKYTLILDGSDVVIMTLTGIIEAFKEQEKVILFNATKSNYPKENIDRVINRDFFGDWRYLNAGCCIGETDALGEFYAEVVKEPENEWHSEQAMVRAVFDHYQEYAAFDWQCKIFQTMGKVNIEQEDDDVFIS
jgi:hypothetical protein